MKIRKQSAMATLEGIEGEIQKLNDEIGKLETERQSAMTERLQISLGDQITAKTGLLAIEKQRLLHMEQQGKSSRVPILPNLLDVILCPISFDVSSSPIQVRRLLKVRSDGYYCNVDVQCSNK